MVCHPVGALSQLPHAGDLQASCFHSGVWFHQSRYHAQLRLSVEHQNIPVYGNGLTLNRAGRAEAFELTLSRLFRYGGTVGRDFGNDLTIRTQSANARE
ncbi:hypothetical protein KCP73_12915 [Salmonella enterica subsp. enterica]|nr:hypothetical protein KCP73_12915 [Salmonella enterica subsp. enterica]